MAGGRVTPEFWAKIHTIPAVKDDDALAESVSLIAELEQLRQQVEDLRAFERDYRMRLLAFHEDRARALKEGKA
jgi:hypothetical protein